jgi:hypothetical protein
MEECSFDCNFGKLGALLFFCPPDPAAEKAFAWNGNADGASATADTWRRRGSSEPEKNDTFPEHIKIVKGTG